MKIFPISLYDGIFQGFPIHVTVFIGWYLLNGHFHQVSACTQLRNLFIIY